MRDDWLGWLQDMAGDAAKADVRSAMAGFWPPTGDGQPPWPTPMGDPTEMFRAMWETWFTMAETMVANVWGMGQQAASTVAAATDPPGRESLSLQVVAGHSTLGTLWLKNRSSTPLDGLRVRSSMLKDSSGESISGDHVHCRLHHDGSIPGGANVRVDVEVALPADVAPGVYEGILLVDGHEDACRPLQLRVLD
ncbi:MAG: hypothetical protein AAF480_12015 [Actinomycetota bacterium]